MSYEIMRQDKYLRQLAIRSQSSIIYINKEDPSLWVVATNVDLLTYRNSRIYVACSSGNMVKELKKHKLTLQASTDEATGSEGYYIHWNESESAAQSDAISAFKADIKKNYLRVQSQGDPHVDASTRWKRFLKYLEDKDIRPTIESLFVDVAGYFR